MSLETTKASIYTYLDIPYTENASNATVLLWKDIYGSRIHLKRKVYLSSAILLSAITGVFLLFFSYILLHKC